VTLRQKIQQEIHERGPIPFSRYMELCLYDPEFGYYSRAREQFGKGGDFYTSSDVHAVFGRLLARQFEEMWRALDSPEPIEVFELGPGRGLFAQDVLDWSEKMFPDFYRAARYTLAESSPSLNQRLASRFRERIEAGKVTVLAGFRDVGPSSEEVVQTPSDEADHRPIDLRLRPTGESHERRGSGFSRPEKAPTLGRALAPEVPLIVFANEFFDALPVEILSAKGSLRVAARDGRFLDEWAASTEDELDFLDHYGVHPDANGRTEIALLSQAIMTRVATGIERGFLIAIDYGYTREQQLAGRHLDTLMTYRRHTATPDPYQAPGEQDITAHVNFTALSAAAEQGGLQVKKLRTQSQFLLGIGEATQFADAFEDCRLPQERAKVAMQVKHLVTPEGMGETFQVLVASKGVDAGAVEKLSGLNF
jgi:SAM-dependent MidA family methyltransferase